MLRKLAFVTTIILTTSNQQKCNKYSKRKQIIAKASAHRKITSVQLAVAAILKTGGASYADRYSKMAGIHKEGSNTYGKLASIQPAVAAIPTVF